MKKAAKRERSPRFIQIAVTTLDIPTPWDFDGSSTEGRIALFGLTKDGRVFRWTQKRLSRGAWTVSWKPMVTRVVRK